MKTLIQEVLNPYWHQNGWSNDDGTFNFEKLLEILEEAMKVSLETESETDDLIFNTLKHLKGVSENIQYAIKTSGYFGSEKFQYIGTTSRSPITNELTSILQKSTGNPLAQIEHLYMLKKLTPVFEKVGIHINLDTNLEKRTVKKVKKAIFIANERETSRGKRYSFTFDVILDTEEVHPVAKKDFFGSRGYLKVKDLYIIIPKEIREALEAQIEDVSADEAVGIASNPNSFFPPGTDLSIIDLKDYDSRVCGFELFKTNSFQEIISSGVEWYPKDGVEEPFVSVRNQAGENIKIPVNEDFIKDLITKIKTELNVFTEMKKSIEPAVQDNNGNYVQASVNNLKHLEAILAAIQGGRKSVQPKPESNQTGQPTAIIQEISHDVDSIQECPELTEIEINYFLNDGIKLKPHQIEGINWLLSNYYKGQGGVILADDMGLGKTLQILTFMAIVKFNHLVPKLKHLKISSVNSPSMVIAPLILLRNWHKEITKFIRSEFIGNVILLHGKDLVSVQKSEGGIDGDWYTSFNLIITNYSTFSRFQRSLLKINYAVNVFDESQNIKNPDTAQTRAARGLKSQFCICATGTPVENRLLDLWPQVSTLNRKPNNPLGTLQQFIQIEKELSATQFTRDRLNLGKRDTILLRRDKSLLREQKVLKNKTIHDPITIPMNTFQEDQERIIISEFKEKPLQILQNLQKLYQHPALLIKDATSQSTEWYIENSPKLEITIKLLEEIKGRKEKVLVFTLWIDMQIILKKVLEEKFGLSIKIINGDTNSKQTAFNSAETIIESFSDVEGFNILILSPLAAGAGLNIVAANNVIHYGRWWNPAKEDQGTDRAYRIGQTKDVNVYYPILTTKNGLGFDQKLHNEVLKLKRELAADVLNPISKMDVEIKDEEGVEENV